MGVCDQDPVSRRARCFRQIRDEAIGLFVRQPDKVCLKPEDPLRCVAADRLQDEDVSLKGAVNAISRIVASCPPHAMVDPDGWGRIAAGVAEAKEGSCGLYLCGRHVVVSDRGSEGRCSGFRGQGMTKTKTDDR